MRNIKKICTVFILAVLFAGCFPQNNTDMEMTIVPADDLTAAVLSTEHAPDAGTLTEITAEITTESYITETPSAGDGNTYGNSMKAFDISEIPEYTGYAAYVEINNNLPYFTAEDITTDSFEYYSELDDLGRCGAAYACIGRELMPVEERGGIGQIKPSGWHTVKYNDIVEGNYVYNRCHLIAYCLCAENANEKNLITGTRYLNIDGMLPFETKTAEYMDNNPDNHVLYRVTPLYTGNNLVADGVLMEGYSVEDNGRGVCFCIYAYNVQPGLCIDYRTGEVSYTGKFLEEAVSVSAVSVKKETNNTEAEETGTIEEEKSDAVNHSDEECTYILNTNTLKFHTEHCAGADRISDKNREKYSGTRDELLSKGFSPCGICRP